jgi:hypothetical protein
MLPRSAAEGSNSSNRIAASIASGLKCIRRCVVPRSRWPASSCTARARRAWHLKARHIKPWRHASDAERLDGANGLLLSPHIDHLFDEGYITFSSSQQLAIVPEVRDTLLDAWGIELSRYSHRRPDISGTANVGSWPRSRLTSAWRAFRSSPLATLSTATV